MSDIQYSKSEIAEAREEGFRAGLREANQAITGPFAEAQRWGVSLDTALKLRKSGALDPDVIYARRRAQAEEARQEAEGCA